MFPASCPALLEAGAEGPRETRWETQRIAEERSDLALAALRGTSAAMRR